MGRKTDMAPFEGEFEVSAYSWDVRRFSDMLAQNNALDADQAMDIAKFVRDEVDKMDGYAISIPVIEKMVEKKMQAYGLEKSTPVRLDKSVFADRAPQLSENARTVLKKRYLKKNSKGHVIETPEKMFRRVARHIAKAEKKYEVHADAAELEENFYRMMTEFKFLPNSPTLMNAGRRLGQLAACFVLPVADSMDDIFDSIKHAALIHKSGGGTGFSFSRLRPANSRVGTTGGVASGPVSFMKVFNTATEQVKQGGTRRGANMGILRVDHPDILEFIFCKRDDHALNNFNISVAVTDAFMDAAAKGKPYDLVDPTTKETVGQLNAKEVYDLLVGQAWKNGDPGVVFIDQINKYNPTPAVGEMESTNPCGEQPLLPMEACNLGSINLAKFVTVKKKSPVIDFESLKETIHLAVRFLDNTIDMSRYPLKEIDAMVHSNRKIGLGVMGFSDLLFQLGVPYDSEDGLAVAESVMQFIQKESHLASKQLADERGVFANFDKSIFKNRKNCKYRNATTTTIAPTGTLSIISGCSSGVEPLFALSFVRTVMDNDQLVEVNPYFEKTAKERGFYSEELMSSIAKLGSIHGMEAIPEDVRRVFVTAHDVLPEWHVRMQAAFQKYTDNAVSKTVNLPKDATEADVKKVYDLAFGLGCKGITIYRDGSKENQVLSVAEALSEDDGFMAVVKDRPETLEGFTTRIKTGMGHLYVTVTEYERRPFEVFATIGKSGKSTTAKTEAIGRLISLALRSGVTVENIVEQVKGIRGEHTVFHNGSLVLSIPDAIGRVLEERYLKNADSPAAGGGTRANSLKGDACPDCGQSISFEEGCKTCHACGYSKCG